jgi:hypothetical protein
MVGEQDTSTGLPLLLHSHQNSQEALQQISLNAICANQANFSFPYHKKSASPEIMSKNENFIYLYGYVF